MTNMYYLTIFVNYGGKFFTHLGSKHGRVVFVYGKSDAKICQGTGTCHLEEEDG